MYAWVSSTLVTCLARTKVAASLRLSWVRSAGRGGRLAQPAAASASVSTAADRRNMVVSLMRATPGYPVWSVLGTRVRPQANDVETGRGYCYCYIKMSWGNCAVKMSSPHGDFHDEPEGVAPGRPGCGGVCRADQQPGRGGCASHPGPGRT